MIGLLIQLLIIVLVLGVAWWIINLIPLPPPFHAVAQVVIVIIALIWLISLLGGFAGWGGPSLWHCR